ncbi:hypothetical protein ACFLYY_00665 [Patescibacteria group bacterium]
MKKTFKDKYEIAVCGASQISQICSKDVIELSKEVGREIARQGCNLITGATTGCPDFAAQGTKEEGGISVGFSPAASKKSHNKTYRLPVKFYDVMIYTGFDYSGRNLIMTRAADAVVVICGRIGTLNEFTIAYEDKKPIGVLEGSGGTADIIKELLSGPHRKGAQVIYEKDPKKLIKKLIYLIKKNKGRKN